jgi:hypothetical protein
VTFVDYYKIKEIGRVIAEAWFGGTVGVAPGHEGLEDRKEYAAIPGNTALATNDLRVDPHQCIFGKGAEFVEGLIGEDVAVCEE